LAHKLLLGTLLGLFAPTTVFAQSAAVPEGVGVADRARPDFSPIGGRLGSFFLYPTFAATLDATDNARARTDDRVGDVYSVISAKARLQSNFSRHGLKAQAYVDQSVHADATSENLTRFGGQLDGFYDVSGETRISALVRAEHTAEPRISYTSPLDGREPGRYDVYATSLTVQQTLSRLDVAATAGFRATRFHDVPLESGAILDQRYRDADSYNGSLLLGYRVRTGMSVILRTTLDKINYRLDPNDPAQPLRLDRDSKGFRTEGGFRFDLSSLLYGEVRFGYYKRSYADAKLVPTSGLSFGADLLWNVTPLTSIRVGADRRVDEAASITIAGNRATEFELSVDHELQRNVILSANGRYADIKPLGPLGASKEYYGGASARLLVSRRLSLRARYQYSKRSSPVVGRAYHENHGLLSAILTF
jgi:hypothetical protein